MPNTLTAPQQRIVQPSVPQLMRDGWRLVRHCHGLTSRARLQKYGKCDIRVTMHEIGQLKRDGIIEPAGSSGSVTYQLTAAGHAAGGGETTS